MKLKGLNKYLGLFILAFVLSPLNAEEEINIWSKEKKQESQLDKVDQPKTQNTTGIIFSNQNNYNIEIQNEILKTSENIKIFGIYDPAENDFDLNMWSSTNAEDVRSSIKRINKIKLSNTATNLFENTILSFAYPPQGMDEEEFVNLKINWLMDNAKVDLIEIFLKQNSTFPNKRKLIQYLVDINIAKADIKEGCKKINFLDKEIKDSYLEKFKIYCLVFNKKKTKLSFS